MSAEELMKDKRYRRLVRAIRKLSDEEKYPPSLRELGKATGEAWSTVHFRLRRLREAGVVDFKSGTARTVRLVA